jgi:hypothetical protein
MTLIDDPSLDIGGDEQYCVVFAVPNGDGVLVYGPFEDDEEARTFVACGPHGLEVDTLATIQPLYPPHAIRLELSDMDAVIPALLDVSK